MRRGHSDNGGASGQSQQFTGDEGPLAEFGGGPFTFAAGSDYDHGKMTMVRSGNMKTKTIPAGKFKAQCLALIDDVFDGGEEVLITKRGQVKARLVPPARKDPESIFGALRGLATIHGDLVSPIVEPREWDEDIFPPGTPGRGPFESTGNKSAVSAANRKTASGKSVRTRK
jgi:antitoxin (DNA-binding transcriptional repressor) of toxin-antitoxin stability system